MASGTVEWFSDASEGRVSVSDRGGRADLRCGCGYGIVAVAPLPTCPMCGASAWEESPRRSSPAARPEAVADAYARLDDALRAREDEGEEAPEEGAETDKQPRRAALRLVS
jgi:predicted  nucleic acid-binding Zn-ribbon protein